MKKLLMAVTKKTPNTLSAFALPIFVALFLALFNYWYQYHTSTTNIVYADATARQITITNGIPNANNKCYDYRVRALDEAGNYSPWATMQENNVGGSIFVDQPILTDRELGGNLSQYLRVSPTLPKTIPVNGQLK